MGNIPLPALAIRPPEQQADPMGQLTKLMALRSMMTRSAVEQQQLQLQTQRVKDQQLTQQYLASNPKSTFGDAAEALKGQISTEAYTNLMDTDATIRQKHSAATQADLDNLQKVHGEQQRLYNNAANLSDPDLQQQWPALASQFNAIPGNPMKLDPAKPLTKDQLPQFGTALGLQEAYLKQEADKRKEAAETGEAISKGQEAQATAESKRMESEWYKTHPGVGAPGVSAELPQEADWLAKNPDKTPADFLKYKATLVPQFNFNLQSGLLTDQARDMAAENYFQTGQLPAGARSPAMIAAIINRAGELHPGGNLAGNKAAYAANKQSLESIQKNFDQVTAFENTAGKNLDTFLTTAKKVVDAGSPWINKPLRSVDANGLGDTDQAAFNAARATALTEIAKVLNSANASGVLSDSARQEVSELIGPGATLHQIYSAAQILKQDMANRHQSYQMQIDDIHKRLGVGPTAETTPQPATSGAFSWDNMPEHKP